MDKKVIKDLVFYFDMEQTSPEIFSTKFECQKCT